MRGRGRCSRVKMPVTATATACGAAARRRPRLDNKTCPAQPPSTFKHKTTTNHSSDDSLCARLSTTRKHQQQVPPPPQGKMRLCRRRRCGSLAGPARYASTNGGGHAAPATPPSTPRAESAMNAFFVTVVAVTTPQVFRTAKNAKRDCAAGNASGDSNASGAGAYAHQAVAAPLLAHGWFSYARGDPWPESDYEPHCPPPQRSIGSRRRSSSIYGGPNPFPPHSSTTWSLGGAAGDALVANANAPAAAAALNNNNNDDADDAPPPPPPPPAGATPSSLAPAPPLPRPTASTSRSWTRRLWWPSSRRSSARPTGTPPPRLPRRPLLGTTTATKTRTK